MIKEYNPNEIEKKWQDKWAEKDVFKSENKADGKENYYVLEMFAYPSGKLHVGHLRNYAIGDAIARYKKMKGFNVLHPFGWDSFGLPAENAAIDHGAHPGKWTKANIDNMRRQLKLMGLSYDWDRELSTYTPEYYKWNQKFFIEMYKKGLVYKKKSFVNWCPDCNTVLANEQVEDGKCWRHSKTDVIQKELSQWYFKITDYAEELLQGHEELRGHWPEQVLTMQKNWIGKSTGSEVDFILDYKFENNGHTHLKLNDKGEVVISVFTTRPDTLYGVTYATVAPEHPLVEEVILKENPSIREKVEAMRNEDKIARIAEDKEKEGVFSGLYVINPVNGEKVQLWVANYVLMDYGTGAVMAVPAHDERDFQFAKKYNLDLKIVVNPVDQNGNLEEVSVEKLENALTVPGVLVNSEEFNGLRTGRASTTVFEKLSVESYGSPTPLNQLATISVPDARMVVIQPWDKNLLGDIEKAILKANLGMTPSNDGKLIRISIPPLTDERRAEIVKQAKKISENYKVAIRNIRRDGIDDAKRQEKSGDMTEDQRKVMEDKLQKLTDTYTEKVTKVLATKEAEIMEG